MDFIKKYKLENIDMELLNVALTHSSYANEHKIISYERLEFLGDAVLQLVISDYIYNNYDINEGEMSKLRAYYVCEKALAEIAKNIGYIDYIKVGNGLLEANDTIVADIFESILGVIYLSLGMDKVKEYINATVIPHINSHDSYLFDYKSTLQELVQTDKKSLQYVLVSESGPAHDKTFKVDVLVDGLLYGSGIGKSKKEAEQNAAKSAYLKKAGK